MLLTCTHVTATAWRRADPVVLPRRQCAFGERGALHRAVYHAGDILCIAAGLWIGFDARHGGFPVCRKAADWFEGLKITYYLGIDGISLFMVLLTTFLMPICILCSWESITTRVRGFMVNFLILESFVIGVFCALDVVMFYTFFEGMLIPMYLIIGIWGGKRRIYAAYKFFLYTFAGSVLFLVAILYLYLSFGTTSIPELIKHAPTLGLPVQQWLWLAMFASFAVKVPMWPVHTWLPDAHVQAPTAGSVILAGILLKMGAYGFLRFSLPMLPAASHYFAPLIFGLSVIAVIYTSLVALMQQDMKKLIAYSSVAHMGFVTIGIFAFNMQGVEGAIIQMISHGLVSGALFLCVGVLYDRLHTRDINRYGGVVNIMPRYALLFMIFTMASVGLPSTSGFVGEFLVLLGAFQANTMVAFFATTGVVLGAAYMLWLYRRVVFGELVHADVKVLPDVGAREIAIFLPIVLLVLWIGIYPKPYLSAMDASVTQLIQAETRVRRGNADGRYYTVEPLCDPAGALSRRHGCFPADGHGLSHQARHRRHAWRHAIDRCAARHGTCCRGWMLRRMTAFNGMFASDGFIVFAKLLILAAAGLVVLISADWLKRPEPQPAEFLVLLLLAVLGMMLMVSANNLLTLYMALEMSSLSQYVLASFNRDHAKSSEAGLKYFVLGALASGMMLFGMSLVYGFAGTTGFDALAKLLVPGQMVSSGVVVGLVLIIIGFCFKLSAVPFHMWTPDVYEGAPTPVTAFFATAPKIAALALFTRFLLHPFAHLVMQWQQVIVFVSVASMLVGALAAIMQTNIKRLLAYSSIGHVGFMLIGLAAANACRCRGDAGVSCSLYFHERRRVRLRAAHAARWCVC